MLVPAVAQVLPKQAPELIRSKQERKADTNLPVKVDVHCNFIDTIVFTLFSKRNPITGTSRHRILCLQEILKLTFFYGCYTELLENMAQVKALRFCVEKK